MEFVNFINSMLSTLKEAMNNISWIFTSFEVGDLVITPIAIISFGTLSFLIPIAIGKWLVS